MQSSISPSCKKATLENRKTKPALFCVFGPTLPSKAQRPAVNWVPLQVYGLGPGSPSSRADVEALRQQSLLVPRTAAGVAAAARVQLDC